VRQYPAPIWLRLGPLSTKVRKSSTSSPSGARNASLDECRALAEAFDGGKVRERVDVIVTAGRDVLAEARKDGVLTRLEATGVKVLPDVCWCSISEPVFPSRARTLMTNSGKYAHYGPGLSGRSVRFGSLADCVEAAVTGKVAKNLPIWLS
jgi:predicted aconitase